MTSGPKSGPKSSDGMADEQTEEREEERAQPRNRARDTAYRKRYNQSRRQEEYARLDALATQPDAPWVAVAPEIAQYADATRRLLRTWRTDAQLSQFDAAARISALIAPGASGARLSSNTLSIVEREPGRVLGWSVRMLLAARLAYGRSLAEWGEGVEAAVARWRVDTALTTDPATRSFRERAVRIRQAQARVAHHLPRLSVEEQEQLALFVETLARSHGGYAGHQTPESAMLEAFEEIDRLTGGPGLPSASADAAGALGAPDEPPSLLPPGTPDDTDASAE